MRTALLRTTAMVAALAFAAVACGGGSGGSTTFEAGVGGGTADSTDQAFTATTLDGGAITFADYAGQDVMLWFWAPW